MWTIIGLVVIVMAMAAAGQMAKRKERRVNRWVTCAFLFPPVLMLLWVLPTRRASTIPAGTTTMACPACGGTVSTSAPACPHCGHPLPVKDARQWFSLPLEIAGILAVGTYIGAGMWAYAETSGSDFPRCDSNLAENDVNSAIANAPLGKVMGLTVIRYGSIDTVSSNTAEEQCHALVTLSNDKTIGMSYRFYRNDNQIFVSAKLDE